MKGLLEYNGYHAKIDISLEDNCFVGTVIGINDDLHFNGKDLDELKNYFKICIEDYIDMCKEFGREPDKEYKGSFNIRISSELHKKLDVAAVKNDMTLNQYIGKVLESSFDEQKVKEIVYVVPVVTNKQGWTFKSDINNYKQDNKIENSFFKEVINN